MMVHCWLCGIRFKDHLERDKTKAVCDGCFKEDRPEEMMDYDEEQTGLLYAFKKIRNFPYQEQDLMLLAKSEGFSWLCLQVLPLMGSKELRNLLLKEPLHEKIMECL